MDCPPSPDTFRKKATMVAREESGNARCQAPEFGRRAGRWPASVASTGSRTAESSGGVAGRATRGALPVVYGRLDQRRCRLSLSSALLPC